MLRRVVISALLCVILLVPAVFADTIIRSYGLVISKTPMTGPGGGLHHYDLLLLNPDGTGYYTYTCNRPLLGPCANVEIGRYVEVNAYLVGSCSSTHICGVGQVASLIYID